MSSSTSNFDPLDCVDTGAATGIHSQDSERALDADGQSRWIFLRIVLAIVLVSVCAMGLVRVFLDANQANKSGILGRVAEAQAALGRITAEPHELVIFFGSSMTQAGFSPRQFDEAVKGAGHDIKSFNFGFGGLNPYFQDYLSRRIAEAFKASDRRLKLAMIEFNPFQSTKVRWQGAESSLDSFITMLATDEELLQLTLDDVTRGVRLFNIKYVRNQVSAEMITSYFAEGLFPAQREQVFKDDEGTVAARKALEKQLNEAFKREYPDFKGEEWSYDWQGGGTIPEERSAETLALFEQYNRVAYTDAYMQNDRLSRIRSADIEDLVFEPRLIESFIGIVKNFQSISDRVEVIMLPRNSRWIQYSPQARARLDAAVAQIAAATGVQMVDHQLVEGIDESMFRDTTHLDRYKGDVAYTQILVREFTGNW
jgi:hypothetical protein